MTWSAPGVGEAGRRRGFGWGSLYEVSGEGRWIYRYTIEDVITLRFGIEVQDRYLVINNQPFSHGVRVTGHEPAALGAAALRLNPAACAEQLPALFASAMERLRGNAASGAACLAPLMTGGAESVEAAGKRHALLFGFEPVHPAGGEWTWDTATASLRSTVYGPPWAAEQPAFDPEGPQAGLLEGVCRAGLAMEFEDEGLRSTVRWKSE
jgi:hypothetical protein